MCLHREARRLFTEWETRYLQRLAPHLAEGLRAGLLADAAEPAGQLQGPALVVLDPAGEVVAATEQAGAWFAELADDRHAALPAPPEVYAVAARLLGSGSADQPADLTGLPPAELAPVIMHAYGLSPQERVVTGMVCQGRSTSEIAAAMCVSAPALPRTRWPGTAGRARRVLRLKALP
ncbi:MAG TPA: hypothetical protein VF834_08825 [Streptosporangiaceae bacterium]